MTRTGPPRDFEGKFTLNFARTAPFVPCGRELRPQIERKCVPLFSCARARERERERESERERGRREGGREGGSAWGDGGAAEGRRPC